MTFGEARLHRAYLLGKEKGIEKGIAQGIEKGKLEERRKFREKIQKLMNKPVIAVEEVIAILDRIEQ